MKVIDAFVYFNEDELAIARLRYYADTVDAFIVTESNLTWNAQPNTQKFPRVLDKLPQDIKDKIHYKFVEHPEEWTNERKRWKYPETDTKNEMAFIAKEHYDVEDLFLFSDIDEFWDIRKLDEMKQVASNKLWFTCINIFHVCHVDWWSGYGDEKWFGTRGTQIKNLVHESPLLNEIISFKKSKNVTMNLEGRQLVTIPYNGWHFSKFGTVAERSSKFDSLVETRHWPEKAGKTMHEIAQAGTKLHDWNTAVGKKKLNGRQLTLEQVKEKLDPELFNILKDYKTFWSGAYEV